MTVRRRLLILAALGLLLVVALVRLGAFFAGPLLARALGKRIGVRCDMSLLGRRGERVPQSTLARKEQDVNMKKEIVSRLSNMRSKVATDYMIELLGK